MSTSHTRAGVSAGLDTRMSTAGNADMSAFAHSLTHIGRAIAFAGLSSILMGAAVTLGAHDAWAGEASPQPLASKEAETSQASEAEKEAAARASEAKEDVGKSAPELKKAKTESELEEKPVTKQEKRVNQMVQRAAMDARAAKSAPQDQNAQDQKTELSITLQWGEMNDAYAQKNNKRLIPADADFGQLSTNWAWGTTRHPGRSDIEDAFKNIDFQITDTDDNTTVTKKGTMPDNAATTFISLGEFNSNHSYKVSIVNSSLPSPYFVTYNCEDLKNKPEFSDDVSFFNWDPSKRKDVKQQQKGIRIDVLEIVYAKDEDVANSCFSYKQPQDASGNYLSQGNWNFRYTEKNIFARLRVKDNKIQFPKTDPIKPGFKFAGWQFYVARINDKNRPYTSFDRMFDDEQKIIKNTTVAYVPFDEQTTAYLIRLRSYGTTRA